MNEKSKATGTLWRVNYTHVINGGHIRAGSIAVEAVDLEEATKVASQRLDSFGLKHHRIAGAKEY